MDDQILFKKSLIAVAVLGATAFSVQAADVTMYGKVDTGLQFKTNEVTEGNQTVTDTDTFSMENGLNSASRFGIKGSEDLGNGMKVSFQLENGFKSDSGEFKTEGKLFDRQATVAVSSDFGTLTMGRVGGIGSGAGFDLVLRRRLRRRLPQRPRPCQVRPLRQHGHVPDPEVRRHAGHGPVLLQGSQRR